MSWNLDGPYRCSYQHCKELFWDEKSLKHHETYQHFVPVTCPYISQCQRSTEKYTGLLNLRQHIIAIHAPLFSEPSCFHSDCQTENTKPFRSWPAVVRHIILEHQEAVGLQPKSTTETTEKRLKSKKCAYNNCTLLFKSRQKFHDHLIACHPYPLRCPYNSQCNKSDSAENYLGLMKLEEHLKANRPEQHRSFLCFDSACQQEKQFQNWSSLVDHLVKEHWIDIKSN